MAQSINTRVDVAEQIAVQKYQKNNPATEEVVGDEFDQS
jgi:chorismate mutase